MIASKPFSCYLSELSHHPLWCSVTPPLFRSLFLLAYTTAIDLKWLPCSLESIYPQLVYLMHGSDYYISVLKILSSHLSFMELGTNSLPWICFSALSIINLLCIAMGPDYCHAFSTLALVNNISSFWSAWHICPLHLSKLTPVLIPLKSTPSASNWMCSLPLLCHLSTVK